MFILQGKSGENSAGVRWYVEDCFSTFNAVRYHSNRNLKIVIIFQRYVSGDVWKLTFMSVFCVTTDRWRFQWDIFSCQWWRWILTYSLSNFFRHSLTLLQWGVSSVNGNGEFWHLRCQISSVTLWHFCNEIFFSVMLGLFCN